MKQKIEIEVSNILVEEKSPTSGWYRFDYSISTDGKKPQKGKIDGTYSSQTRKHFLKVLKKQWAFTLVIQKFY